MSDRRRRKKNKTTTKAPESQPEENKMEKEPKIEKNEIKLSPKEEEEEELEIKPEEIPLKPNSLKMDILLSTSSMQHQNGLRAGDYLRYAHFCRKKIQKLRKMNHFRQGKRKFQKVEITPQLIKDNKIFLILILECERNWAYGMYHKQELTFIGEDIKRLRYEITRKFKRATQNAKKI